MDLHIVPGVKAKEAAEAHRMDILIEEEHSCKCMTYWIDEERGHVFCLIKAPDAEAVTTMHNKAHGLVPHRIIEVESSLVKSFLGRVSDPEETQTAIDGLSYFNDPSFRVLLVTSTTDPVLLQHHLGKEKAKKLIALQHRKIREQLDKFEGLEVPHKGSGFIASFTSASNAVSCALAINKTLEYIDSKRLQLKMGIHAGEPVSANAQLFGNTLELAERICYISGNSSIGISSEVKDLISKDVGQKQNMIFTLQAKDEILLNLMFNALEENWQNSDFQISDFCRILCMSKSQLYRKTIALCGYSPNALLQEFRLEKARQLIQQQVDNISRITYNSGFSSPSYFTKCFKKKYNITPHKYLVLCQL